MSINLKELEKVKLDRKLFPFSWNQHMKRKFELKFDQIEKCWMIDSDLESKIHDYVNELKNSYIELPKKISFLNKDVLKKEFMAVYDRSKNRWTVPKVFEENVLSMIKRGVSVPDSFWERYNADKSTLAGFFQEELRNAANSSNNGFVKYVSHEYGFEVEWSLNRGSPTWGVFANVEIFRDLTLPDENYYRNGEKYIFKAPLAIAHKGKLIYIFYSGGISSSVLETLNAKIIYIPGLKKVPPIS